MSPGDRYARFFEDAQTGLLLLEKNTGRILEVNAAFLRTAGRGPQRSGGAHVLETAADRGRGTSGPRYTGICAPAARSRPCRFKPATGAGCCWR